MAYIAVCGGFRLVVFRANGYRFQANEAFGVGVRVFGRRVLAAFRDSDHRFSIGRRHYSISFGRRVFRVFGRRASDFRFKEALLFNQYVQCGVFPPSDAFKPSVVAPFLGERRTDAASLAFAGDFLRANRAVFVYVQVYSRI